MTRSPLGSKQLAVIVPVRDEAATLGTVLRALSESLGSTAQIIVVDDASKDGSHIIAERHDVRLLRHDAPRGYGAAIKTALLQSSQPLVAIIDADGSYDPRDVRRLLPLCPPGGMVVGARRSEPNRTRAELKKMFRMVVRLRTGEVVPDLNSGLRVFDRSIAEALWPFLPDRFSFTTTTTLGALAMGKQVRFEPIDFGLREGRSKFSPLDTLLFARTVWRGSSWMRQKRFEYSIP